MQGRGGAIPVRYHRLASHSYGSDHRRGGVGAPEHPQRDGPDTPRDVEAMFFLSVPLLSIPTDLDGTCRMAVELRGVDETAYAGRTMTVKMAGD